MDKISGGLADGKTVKDIYSRYPDKDERFVDEQLADGIKAELEHTDDEEIAMEIAIDHLWEMIDYYDRLKLVESGRRIQLFESEVKSLEQTMADVAKTYGLLSYIQKTGVTHTTILFKTKDGIDAGRYIFESPVSLRLVDYEDVDIKPNFKRSGKYSRTGMVNTYGEHQKKGIYTNVLKAYSGWLHKNGFDGIYSPPSANDNCRNQREAGATGAWKHIKNKTTLKNDCGEAYIY